VHRIVGVRRSRRDTRQSILGRATGAKVTETGRGTEKGLKPVAHRLHRFDTICSLEEQKLAVKIGWKGTKESPWQNSFQKKGGQKSALGLNGLERKTHYLWAHENPPKKRKKRVDAEGRRC